MSNSESRYIPVGVYVCEYVFVYVYLIIDCCLLASSGGPWEGGHTDEDDETEQDHE